MGSAAFIPLGAACGFLVSALIVAASLHYARRRGLVDQPGRRRSHTQPTPRGGGIGIVVAALLCAMPALAWLPRALPMMTVLALVLAVGAVAAIGWRDDHAPLPVFPRVGVHLLAAFVAAMFVFAQPGSGGPVSWPWLIVIAVVFAGSINAHNFMDGIDGLLGLQALFVFCGYVLLAHSAGQVAVVVASIATASACLGFLLFNLPPARVFMGDVGSGALGLLIAVFAGLLARHAFVLLWPCAILSSAFLVDAGLTLLVRMSGGKRWYTAHREHVYQWMVRAGFSHAQTDGTYMLWNLIIAAPAAWAATHWPEHGFALAAAVYALACVGWCAGKRACLAAARSRNHVVA